MGDVLPAVNTLTIAYRRIRIDDHPFVPAPETVLDSSDVDAGSTPTAIIRPGNVVVLETASGRFREANDAAGDRNAPATVTALITAGVAQQNDTIRVAVNGGPTFDIVLGAGDDTDAEVATALNANARFAGVAIADVVAARVRIRTLEAGSDMHLSVGDTDGTYFGTFAAPATDDGTDADYRVTEDFVDLRDPVNAAAAHGRVAASLAGHYDRSELINLTAEAAAVLSRRGSIFG